MKRGIGLPILFLGVILAASSFVSAPILAQSPPDESPLPVTVSTDKQIYAPGEDIRIRVQITNKQNLAQTLHFRSGYTNDYVLNNAYRWSDGRGFTQALVDIPLAPGQTHVFPEFVHKASDYPLAPGQRHEIRGEVVGYGQAVTTIFIPVVDPAPKLELTPIVRPNPAPFGAVINFAVSVRNVTNTPVTFGHSGCPVVFRIQGVDLPPVACAEYWKVVTLAPGQSILFGPDEFPYLSLGHDRNAFFLPAGTHIVDFEVPGVGTTSARFQVLPGPGGAAISGQVVSADGALVAGATIQAFTPGGNDSTPPPSTAFGTFQAYSGPDGRYRMDVPPGDYLVRAFSSNSSEVWYNQVYSMEEATPVHVIEGNEATGIDFALKSPIVPPPPLPGVIFGVVREAAAAPGDSAAPITDAVVAAFLLRGVFPDSGGPVDSTIVPGTGVYPPYPPEPWPGYPPVFFGFADPNGEFQISVPYGAYRVIAFSGGHRYQWWDGADLTSDADEYFVSPYARQAPLHFALTSIQLTVEARITGLVNRVIPGFTGTPRPGDPGPPLPPDRIVPLEGALVSARPLVLDPRILTFAEVVYQTHSGNDGTFALDVPWTTPFVVDASFDGLQRQFYNHAPDPFNATPVDVFAGRTTADVGFDLYPEPPQPTFGVISGIIYSDDGTDHLSPPIPGAIVRLRAVDDFPVPNEIATRTDESGRYMFYGLPMASDGSHRYYVSAEAAGHVPNYYPGVYQWTTAQPVEPAPPEARTLTNLTLYTSRVQTPGFTVGFVRAHDLGGLPVDPPPPGDDGGGTGVGGDPSTGGGANSATSPAGARILIETALAGTTEDGPRPLRGAYFYLVPAADAGPTIPTPMAGGVTTENGTVVVENVPPGLYRAYADRPGFELGWFGGNTTAGAGLIEVGEGHEPVLADIILNLKFPPPPGGGEGDANASVFQNLHNAPNPFRPETTIMYQLGVAADVTLKVFDVNGRLVRTLIDRAQQLPGGQAVAWDGRDGAGALVGAGIYFYRVETSFEATVGKMVRAR